MDEGYAGTDWVSERAHAVHQLAAEAEASEDKEVRKRLFAMIDKLIDSVRLPPSGEVISIDGAKNVAKV